MVEGNLVPRDLRLFSQRVGAHPLTKQPEDSGYEIGWKEAKVVVLTAC